MCERTPPTRARCLGWALVIGVVLVLSGLLSSRLHIALLPWALFPSLIAAFLIGVRVRDWRWAAWAASAAVSVAALGGALLAVAVAPPVGQAGPMGLGGGLPYAIMMGSVVFGASVVVGVLHALSAIAGVWQSTRRWNGETRSSGLDSRGDVPQAMTPALAPRLVKSAPRDAVARR